MKQAAVERHPSALAPEAALRARRRRGLAVVGVVAGGLALVAWLLSFGLSRDPQLLRSPLLGRPAPEFALPTLQGDGVVRLSDLRGRVVVLNFWASWCADCRLEHPHLLAAWDRYRERGVVFLGISFEDRRSDALAYLRELGGDWPHLWDPGSSTALAYGVYGVPETFFIGPDGRVAYKQVGPVDYELLTSQIARLLGEVEG
ncbi:MAG TPA: TlpA disulfide reductase family protein [Actinomycetota bacterium]|nr:TlpA disulfide reductase family protein [Actinomycetota bacterium]